MSDIASSSALVLDGQGLSAAISAQALQVALDDSKTPLGGAILLACHEAFTQEYNCLSSTERAACGIDLRYVSTMESLLALPKAYPSNAIVANTHLYLTQLLRFVATSIPGPFDSPSIPEEDAGIFGFSTGMFAAVVIASETSIAEFITNAIEVYRCTFWLGLRAELFAATFGKPDASPPLSWSLVTFGSSRNEIQTAIGHYNTEHSGTYQLYLTAVTNNSCMSVSGHPDALAAFKAKYLPASAYSSRNASIYTLYHSPELQNVKEQVMADLSRRKINFPKRKQLRRSLRSTVSGGIVTKHNEAYSLAEEIVDMTLLQPANFDLVITALCDDLASRKVTALRLINIGPGNVLWRSIARALPTVKFDMVDHSSGAKGESLLSVPSSGEHQAPQREPIAIVGMGVKFPGAQDAAGLWRVLEEGLNTVSEVPSSRFKVSEYNSGAHGAKRSLKARHGNFIDDPSVFDNGFFHVSPREARSMDPQQRLLLQVAYHALENAGYVPGATPSFNPDTFGAYVGVATNDYVQNLRDEVDVYYSTGTLQAFLSGKISYAFGWSGPSLVIDTACSSAMVSIYQACRSLGNKDCNAAIAGGVNVIASPDMYIGLDRAHFLSATGQCKPWDASADGYCRSEGCGMFVLKRLSDALAENDNILGVIRGIEVNQSGNADSITHPHIPTQMNLFKKLVSSTGIKPHQVSVIEAHGTGTKAGDPTEIQSLRAIFAKDRSPANPLHLTSIKSNIGHAEAASGAASLAKLLLMMRHRTIPAVISLKQLNPNIPDLASDGTCIDTKLTSWSIPAGTPERRLALLNNFGAAGSNAALILEEGPSRASPLKDSSTPSVIVGISCESEGSLEEQRSAYIQHLEQHVKSYSDLADFAYTATARRQAFRYRISGHGKTVEEVCASLRTAQTLQVNDIRGKVVFVFSGQGGQYMGMGSRLYGSISAIRRVVDSCHDKLVAWGFPGIKEVIVKAPENYQEDFRAYHCAVYVLECALATLWTSWGIQPDAVAGHSLGEYAALVTAGVLALEDGLRLVAGRAQLMADKCISDDTGMLAVKRNPTNLEELVRENSKYDQLSVACYNSSDDVVVAGKLAQLEELQKELKTAGHKCARVNVPYGYHTRAMDPILDDIKALAAKVKLSAPCIPVLSNVHGTVVCTGDASVFTAEYFARHCGEPVRFEQAVNELMAREDFAKVSAWIEIGPHPTSLSMLRSIPATSHQAMYLPSLRKNTDDWQVLSDSLASLYCVATSTNWRDVFRSLAPHAHLAELPAYPFAKTQYWVSFEESHVKEQLVARPVVHQSTRYTLLGTCVRQASRENPESAIFETNIAKLAKLIEGHKVAGYGLCPASVYIEIASAAAELVLEHLGEMPADAVISLSEISFQNPLVYAPDVDRTVRIEISLLPTSEKHSGKFQVSSYTTDPSKPQGHCGGTFDVPSKATTGTKLSLSGGMVQQRYRAVVSGNGFKPSETFYTRTAYDVIFSRIVAYSSTYHTMKSITIDPNGVDAYAVVRLPADTITGSFVAHPVFMDTLLHAAGFVINCSAGINEAFICSQVDKVKVLPELIKADTDYGVYCNIAFLSETLAVADAYAFELNPSGVVIAAHMKRMRFRKLRMSGFKAILSSAAASKPSIATSPKPAQVSRPAPDASRVIVNNDIRPSPPAPVPVDRIKDAIAGVLGIPASDLSEDQDLERLGMDSLMSIEALHALRSALGVSIPDDIFYSHKTIRDISAAVLPSVAIPSVAIPSVASHISDEAAGAVQSPTDSSTLTEDQVTGDSERDKSLLKAKQIMASVLDIAPRDLGEDQDLERLGMDSLMSIEAHHALCSEMNATLPDDVFMTCKTIRDVHNLICPPRQKESAPLSPILKGKKPVRAFGTDVNPVKLQDGKGIPLFLIHDGSGVAHPYSRLSSLGRPVWGIHNPKFAAAGKWEGGLLEMATHYTGLVKSVLGTSSACLVGGWSVGGVIAFEVARQLIASGVEVPSLVLIDSPHPLTETPLSDEVINAAFSQSSPNRATELARTQISYATAALVEYNPEKSPARHVQPPRAVMLRSREGFQVAKGNSQSDAFLADRRDPKTMVAEWKNILKSDIPVIDIPGTHFEPFEPKNVEEVSRRLNEAISLVL